MPEIGFTDGDVLTAANLNQIEDQIQVTCTSTTRPTGVEGRRIYESDTGRQMVHDGTAWRLDGGVVWNAFTPAWNNLTVGNAGTDLGSWRYQDGGVLVRATITFGSTTSISGAVSLDVPNSLSARADGVRTIGSCYVFDSSTGANYSGSSTVESSGTTISLYASDDNVTSTNPITFTTSDIISVTQFVPIS